MLPPRNRKPSTGWSQVRPSLERVHVSLWRGAQKKPSQEIDNPTKASPSPLFLPLCPRLTGKRPSNVRCCSSTGFLFTWKRRGCERKRSVWSNRLSYRAISTVHLPGLSYRPKVDIARTAGAVAADVNHMKRFKPLDSVKQGTFPVVYRPLFGN